MATKVNSSYVDSTDIAALLDINDSNDETRILNAAVAASRAVDALCNRPGLGGGRGGFWSIAAATAVYRPDPWEIPAEVGDWAAIGTVSTSADGGVTWTDLATTAYQAEPLNAAVAGEPYHQLRVHDTSWPSVSSYPGRPCLRIVGTYGFSAVPEEVEQATRLLTLRWLKRNTSPLGVSGFGDMSPVYVRNSDPDVVAILSRWTYWWAG